MNTLSKTFVVINMLFAAVFCAVTISLYAKKVNYSAEFHAEEERHQETKKITADEIDKLNKLNDKLNAQAKVIAENIANLENRRDQLSEQIRDISNDLATSKMEAEVALKRNDTQKESLKLSYEQIDRMHTIILKQQKAVEVAKENMRNAHSISIERENNFNTLRQQHIALQKENERLEKDLAQQTYLLEQISKHTDILSLIDDAHGKPPMPLFGKVMAVNKELGFVMLDIGSDDNVKKGYRFIISKGEEYIGKVIIEQVHTNMSSARVLNDVSLKEIREGYDAYTGTAGQ